MWGLHFGDLGCSILQDFLVLQHYKLLGKAAYCELRDVSSAIQCHSVWKTKPLAKLAADSIPFLSCDSTVVIRTS